MIQNTSDLTPPRKGKTKPTSQPFSFQLHPNPAAVHLDNPLDQRQANPDPFSIDIQLFKQVEDTPMETRVNSFAVVVDKECALPAILPCTDFYARR